MPFQNLDDTIKSWREQGLMFNRSAPPSPEQRWRSQHADGKRRNVFNTKKIKTHLLEQATTFSEEAIQSFLGEGEKDENTYWLFILGSLYIDGDGHYPFLIKDVTMIARSGNQFLAHIEGDFRIYSKEEDVTKEVLSYLKFFGDPAVLAGAFKKYEAHAAKKKEEFIEDMVKDIIYHARCKENEIGPHT